MPIRPALEALLGELVAQRLAAKWAWCVFYGISEPPNRYHSFMQTNSSVLAEQCHGFWHTILLKQIYECISHTFRSIMPLFEL